MIAKYVYIGIRNYVILVQINWPQRDTQVSAPYVNANIKYAHAYKSIHPGSMNESVYGLEKCINIFGQLIARFYSGRFFASWWAAINSARTMGESAYSNLFQPILGCYRKYRDKLFYLWYNQKYFQTCMKYIFQLENIPNYIYIYDNFRFYDNSNYHKTKIKLRILACCLVLLLRILYL